MNNFAHMPWGRIFLVSWLIRVPFTLTAMMVPLPDSVWEVLLVVQMMVGGIEVATFICWLVALMLRRKLRVEESTPIPPVTN